MAYDGRRPLLVATGRHEQTGHEYANRHGYPWVYYSPMDEVFYVVDSAGEQAALEDVDGRSATDQANISLALNLARTVLDEDGVLIEEE